MFFCSRLSENKFLRLKPRTFVPVLYSTVNTILWYSDQALFCILHRFKWHLKVQDSGQLVLIRCEASQANAWGT